MRLAKWSFAAGKRGGVPKVKHSIADFKRLAARWLEHEGYRVHRFWNNEVMVQTDAVIEAIFFALTLTPTPPAKCGRPSPSMGGRHPRCCE